MYNYVGHLNMCSKHTPFLYSYRQLYLLHPQNEDPTGVVHYYGKLYQVGSSTNYM